MKEQNQRQSMFNKNWEKQRKNKWLYIFLFASIYWGFPTAIISYLLKIDFKFDTFQFTEFLKSLLTFIIVGFVFGYWQFKKNETIYLQFNDDDEIKKGIENLKLGTNWSYENICIHPENENTLIIRNELFWYEEKGLTIEKLNECFNLFYSDFQRLQKNIIFDNFSRNKKIRIQIVDNSGNNIPLVEKIIQS